MTPNRTCEVCWCVVLDKYRDKHEEYHENKGERPEDGWHW